MKKLNKFFAVLVALAMMATLCVMSAFAADPASTADGTYDKLANAYLIKYFQIPEGVTVPSEAFTFTISPKAESVTHENNAKDIPSPTSATDGVWEVTIPASEFTATTPDGDGQSTYANVKLSDVFAGITWPHAGVFTYDVAEKAGSNEDINYSGEKYAVNLYVKYDTTTKTFVVDGATVQKYRTETEVVDEKTTITKEVPYLDKDNDQIVDRDETTNEITVDGFTFTNLYTKETGVDPGDEPDGKTEKGAINLTKEVTGKANDATEFDFTLDLKAAIGHENDEDITYTLTKNGVATQGTFDFAAGVAQIKNIKLASGDAFVINELPAGTKWTATENLTQADHSKYTPKYDVTAWDGTATTPAMATVSLIGEPGTTLVTPADTLLWDKSTGDVAAYTNAYDDSTDTPTGILISNLPYIALALVAIGGLVAYVVVRRRNADEA